MYGRVKRDAELFPPPKTLSTCRWAPPTYILAHTNTQTAVVRMQQQQPLWNEFFTAGWTYAHR